MSGGLEPANRDAIDAEAKAREPSAADGAVSNDTFVLLRRYRELGDRSALERVFERHYPRVERIVRIRLRPSSKAWTEVSDVVQQVMLRAFQNIEQFEMREDARLAQWLSKIVEREIASLGRFHRAQKRDRPRDESNGSSVRSPEELADSTSVGDRIAAREIEAIVDECVSDLPAPYREAILLREYAGGGWRFVADALGLRTADAARKLYERAREALRKPLRARMRIDGDAADAGDP